MIQCSQEVYSWAYKSEAQILFPTIILQTILTKSSVVPFIFLLHTSLTRSVPPRYEILLTELKGYGPGVGWNCLRQIGQTLRLHQIQVIPWDKRWLYELCCPRRRVGSLREPIQPRTPSITNKKKMNIAQQRTNYIFKASSYAGRNLQQRSWRVHPNNPSNSRRKSKQETIHPKDLSVETRTHQQHTY